MTKNEGPRVVREQLYRRFDVEEIDPDNPPLVQYVGVHAVVWRDVLDGVVTKPAVAFVEYPEDTTILPHHSQGVGPLERAMIETLEDVANVEALYRRYATAHHLREIAAAISKILGEEK